MVSSTYQHLFFDMDGTLTRSRTRISEDMERTLTRLVEAGKSIVVISGQTSEAIKEQLGGFPCFVMGQNGNQCWDGMQLLWNDTLNQAEQADIAAHIRSLPRTWDVPNEADLVEDRGAQITYSLYGIHAPLHEKERFDPDHTIRKKLLAEHPLVSETVEVKIAGTTGFDYFKKGHTKGFNIARFIDHKGWVKEECVYFGDMLFPGGNDESVIGVIDTIAVTGPEDTQKRLMER